MRKKTLAAIAVAMSAFLALTGCGAGGGEERAAEDDAGFLAGVLLFFAVEAVFFLLVDLLDAMYVFPTS